MPASQTKRHFPNSGTSSSADGEPGFDEPECEDRSVGFVYKSVDDSKRAAHSKLTRQYVERAAAACVGLLEYRELPNISCMETSVPPKGGFVVYDADAPLAVDFITSSMFYGTSVFRVKHCKISSRKIDKKTGDAVQHFFGSGPSLSCACPTFAGDAPGAGWSPALDTQGSFVGLYRATVFPPGDAAEDIYFVVATAAAGAAGHELYGLAEELVGSTDTTMRDFCGLPEVRYVRNVASRNRAHLARRFAESIGVEIDVVGDFAAAPKQPDLEIGEVTSDKISSETWSELVALYQAGDFGAIDVLLANTAFDSCTAGLLEALSDDPWLENLQNVDSFIVDSDEDTGLFPTMGAAMLETVHNSMAVVDNEVFIYSQCVSPIEAKHSRAVLRLHSPAEGVELYMYGNTGSIQDDQFGAKVNAAGVDVLPSTSGRVQLSTDVSFGTAMLGKHPIPFLHYPEQSSRPNDRALYGPSNVYRPDDELFFFAREQFASEICGNKGLTRTRLMPISVVIPATPLHRLSKDVLHNFEK